MSVSMKNGLLCVCLGFVLITNAQVSKKDSTIDSVKLEKEVIIYGKGIPFRLRERTSTIQEISMSQNDNLPIRSVNEALSFVPGLDLRQRGVQGVQGDLSIRGGTFDQNLILINGFKLVDPQTGHHALSLPVVLTNVESVEVYKGSGTRIFGQNAMTGAVNFVTRPKDEYSVNAQVYGASFGGLGQQFTIHVPFQKLKQSFSVGYDQSNGYWYNSDFTNQHYFYDAALQLSKKQLIKSMVGYTDRSFGANGYYTNAFPDQWESTQMAFAGISHALNLNRFTFLTKVSLRTHRDEFRLKRLDPSFYTNKHWSEVLTVEETGQLKTKLGLTGFGGEFRMESLTSTNLGNRDRTYVSGFLDHKVKLLNEKLILIANVHYFNLTMNGNVYQKLLPGFETAYLLNKQWRLFGNISQSYRAPTYTELFYQDYSNVGNPNLQPEYATNTEVGFEWGTSWERQGSLNRLSFESALYRRNTTNMIDWVRSTTVSPNPWKPVNLSNVLFTGLESNLKYTWNGKRQFMINELTVGYNYIDVNHQFVDDLGLTQSRYAFSGLRNQLVVKVNAKITHWATLTLAYRGTERVGSGSFSLLDAKLQINASRCFVFFLEGNNLLDTNYVEAGYVQMPGRWGKIGLHYNFKGSTSVQK